MKFLRNNHGVSLLELLIYMGILAITVTTLVSLLYPMVRARNLSGSSSEVQQNARLAIEKISQEIKKADAVTLPTDGEDGDSLDLDNTYVVFDVFEEAFRLSQGGSYTKITTERVKISKRNVLGVDQPYFRHVKNPGNAKSTVQLQFKIEYKTTDPTKSFAQDFQTTVMVRE